VRGGDKNGRHFFKARPWATKEGKAYTEALILDVQYGRILSYHIPQELFDRQFKEASENVDLVHGTSTYEFEIDEDYGKLRPISCKLTGRKVMLGTVKK